MKYSVVFSSRTGNTKSLAVKIQEFYGEENCIYFGVPCEKALEADVIFVGFWTDRSKPNAELAAFLKRLKEKKVFLFGTAGFGGSDAYFNKILKKAFKYVDKSNKILGTFMCQGRMPMTVRDRYVKMAKRPIHIPHIQKLIANFDVALSHPNVSDYEGLKKCLTKIIISF